MHTLIRRAKLLMKAWLVNSKQKESSHVGGKDTVDEVLLGQVKGAVELVVVEGHISRAWAVQPGLHERRPSVFKQKPTAYVVLTDPCHPREHRLPTVLLHCHLPQEEVGEASYLVRRDKLRLCGEAERKRKREGWWNDHYNVLQLLHPKKTVGAEMLPRTAQAWEV